FMSYMPITVILTLFASLFVAYIFNPVFAVSFMKHEYDMPDRKRELKRLYKWGGVMLFVALAFFAGGNIGMGNLLIFFVILYVLYVMLLKKAVHSFQEKGWPAVMRLYDRQLRFFLYGRRPYWLLGSLVVLFILSFYFVGLRSPKVLFFPDNEPNNIFVYIKLPEGTDQNVTDSVTRMVEDRVYQVIGKNNPVVESVISNVSVGVGDEDSFESGIAFNKGKINISFVEHKFRPGISTQFYLDEIRKSIKGIPGVEITVNKNSMGPPTGRPINIEISGENLDDLIVDANRFPQNYLDSLQIPGVEELKSDFQESTPEIIIDIDRERANREGLSLGQIGMEVRTAVFGSEISKFKKDEDEFPIQLRYNKELRENIDALINMRITYRDMNTGQLRSIPLSTVAKIRYTDNYGGINRKNLKRVITVYSNVLSGYTANEIVTRIKKLAATVPLHQGVNIELTGEQEDQAETTQFLFMAMIIALGIIFFILITQFNSLSKSMIILSEVVFSIVGVLLGIAIFDLDIIIIMTGLGIVALGGIVVRNGILIVEFIDVQKAKGLKTREAIVEAGKTRITPVLLTATATMLGLVPLAVGLNINFVTLFTEFNPHIYFGGDNVMFWGPLSWTIIFGLSFATFLTLIFVPAMYLIAYAMKVRTNRSNFKRSIIKAQKQKIQRN
ncbi:MAG: efflux RND transporter permease subunit, partial [Bacteroidetes bacterium]|nr:efflux RND transporter permease subunit [Bacteroidota bacterium]